MGALPKPLEPRLKKPVVSDAAPPKRDEFGRDPNSPSEKLRSLTNYDEGRGFSPFYNAALADLPRLSSGAVCYAFVLVVNFLSFGRGKDKDGKWHETTLPISAQALADLCRANLRDIQRQLAELAERGLIKVKLVKRGEYAISLLYRDWRGLEDYAVWKRKQVVAIDEATGEETEDDQEIAPISKDAVRLFKQPTIARPGRATRAVRVSVGVREVVCQNESPSVDAAFNAVVQSGRLVVSATFKVSPKGEEEANAKRHGCREEIPEKAKGRRNLNDTGVAKIPSDVGNSESGKSPTSEDSKQVAALFDPLLQRYGSRLLSLDNPALKTACAEVGAMPHHFLTHYVMTQRAGRSISGPKVVASIVKDARLYWEQTEKRFESENSRALDIKREKDIRFAREILSGAVDWTADDIRWARETLAGVE